MEWKDFSKQKPQQKDDGCKIKVKRDSQGRIKELDVSPKCKREHIEAFALKNGINLDEGLKKTED